MNYYHATTNKPSVLFLSLFFAIGFLVQMARSRPMIYEADDAFRLRGVDFTLVDDDVVGDSIEQPVTYPASDSILEGSSVLARNNDGYTGDAFIDFGGVGSSASWVIAVPVGGPYDVTLRYASRGDRGPLDLLVNEAKKGNFEIDKVANDWNTWKDETIRVDLDAGTDQKLTLLASVIQGPNVDKISLLFRGTKPPNPGPQPPDTDYETTTILTEGTCLPPEDYKESPSGIFEFGLQQETGSIVVRRKESPSVVLWSLPVWNNQKDDPKLCLQNNGNLVVLKDKDKLPDCDNDDDQSLIINGRDFAFAFGMNNSGGIAIYLDPQTPLWTGGLIDDDDDDPPTMPPTPVPTSESPTMVPTFLQTLLPPPLPTFVPGDSDLEYRQVLTQNNYFGRSEQNFGQSNSGEFRVGLNANGHLVVRKTEGNNRPEATIWILRDDDGNKVTGDRLYMQNDGNLVMRDGDREATWTSQTADPTGKTGFSFGINNCGGVAVVRASNANDVVWEGGIQDICLVSPPIPMPSLSPGTAPVSVPSPAPVTPASRPPTSSTAYNVILAPNGRLLERDRFVSSPNGNYEVGLNSNGQFIMRDGGNKSRLWSLEDKNGVVLENISKIFMQSDGNLVMKTSGNNGVWNSETSKNPGGEFRINDGGQLSVNYKGTSLWIDGLPRGIYTGPPPSGDQLKFPVRGFFYYAWYPETWTVGGKPIKYRPNLGTIGEGPYSSGDPVVVENHVKALDYAWADLSIVSWWGPSDRLDRARITQLLDETVTQGSSIKWTVYYEDEKQLDRTVDELMADLEYLKEWFAWHESWAHKDGKPVIFIWNESECEVADRWTEAAKRANWYVVLKLFGNYLDCKSQPDSWHQYGVSSSYLEYDPFSFTIGPGFFRADTDRPDVPRASPTKFCGWVDEMNRSEKYWQLVVSFNEWGEGTAVESAVEWNSSSRYGKYLDCLHDPSTA